MEYDKRLKIRKKSEFSLEFKATKDTGVIFYVSDEGHAEFLSLFLKDGQLVYGWNCGSGPAFIETEENYADGEWHYVQFTRNGDRGRLYVDRVDVGEQRSIGQTKSLEIGSRFFLGGVTSNMYETAQNNLGVSFQLRPSENRRTRKMRRKSCRSEKPFSFF